MARQTGEIAAEHTMPALTVAAAVLATAAAAPATPNDLAPDCGKRLLRSARHHRAIVVHRHGVDAAGRDILHDGIIGPDQHPHRAPCRKLRRYRDQLIVLHTEPPQHPLIARTAVLPYRPPAGARTPSVAAPPGGTLSSIAQCESGGNYNTDTGNGFYGAYQFTLSTWQSVGGTGNPADASPAEQDRRAAILYSRAGPSPWPVCGR